MTAAIHLAMIVLAVSSAFLLMELIPVQWLRDLIERKEDDRAR